MSTVYIKDEFKRKRVNPLIRILFSRFFIIIGLIIFQFWLLFYFGNVLLEGPISIVVSLLNVILAIVIINKTNQKAEYKLIWIILIGVVPGAGLLLYLLLSINRYFGANPKKILANIEETAKYIIFDSSVFKNELPIQEQQIYSLLFDDELFVVHTDNEIRYLKNGTEYFDTLFEELEKAQKLILIEYFIISDGVLWQKFIDILKRKTKEGVEVYLMYDGLNSLFSFSLSDFKDLHEAGIQTKMFAPIIPFITYSQNSRDHRKVVIIDNKVVITGGINLGDEYANIIERFGRWKDSGIVLKGDVAMSFTAQYLQIYNLSIRETKRLSIDKCMSINNRYLLEDNKSRESNIGSYVASITDFPWIAYNVHERLFKTIINCASNEVFITTPYLIIDSTMLDTIKIACNRGIHITFIVPHIPDKAYAFILTRSYFQDLLSYGCDIYEYTPGFIHQKVVVADYNRAYVGTCNFDYRSLFLHYENGVYIYNNNCIKDIREDIDEIINESQRMTLDDVKRFSISQKLFGPILKLFAPLM